MDFPMTMWNEWILQTLPPTFVMLSNPSPCMLFSNMEQVEYKIMEPLFLLIT